MATKSTTLSIERTPKESPDAKNDLLINDDDISQLEALLSQPLTNQKVVTNKTTETAVQFLLTEYNVLADLWKHTDARFESGVNIYLTASALVVSGIVFLSQRINELNSFLFITIFVALALSVAGRILSGRLLTTSFNKAEYIYARDLIRRFFAEESPEIIPYLYFLRDRRSESMVKESVRIRQLRTPRTIISVINLWVSSLLGSSASIVVFLINPSLDLILIVIIGVAIAVIILMYLSFAMKREIDKFDLRPDKQ